MMCIGLLASSGRLESRRKASSRVKFSIEQATLLSYDKAVERMVAFNGHVADF